MDALQAALKVEMISLTARRNKSYEYIHNSRLQLDCILLQAQIDALMEEYAKHYKKEV